MPKIPSIPDHLQDVLQERMSTNFEYLFKSSGDHATTKNLSREDVKIVICKKTGTIYGGQKGFYTLGYHNYLTEKERKEIWDWRTRNVEKNRFKKAKKIKFSDWKGDQLSDGDEFFMDLEDFFEGMIEEHGFQYDLWTKYIWPTKLEPIIKSKEAFRVYEGDLENVSDEYDWDVKGTKELQESLDEFVEANKGTTAYYPDYSTVLLIDDQIESFKKNYED